MTTRMTTRMTLRRSHTGSGRIAPSSSLWLGSSGDDTLMARAQKSETRYARLRAQGKCVRCGRAAADHGARCEACAAKAAERQRQYDREHPRKLAAYLRARYARLRAQGSCVGCGRAVASHGIYCAACAAKLAERQRRFHLAHPQKRAAYSRARYARLRAQGSCVGCGRAVASHGIYCGACAAKLAERQGRYHLAHRQERAAYCRARYARLRAQGKCVGCGRAVASHGARCEECARKLAANARARRARRQVGSGAC